MIYTVTLNPSWDHTVTVENFDTGKTNRVTGESFTPGGKGINVATMLYRFHISVRALGFVAGFTGNAIEEHLQAEGLFTDFIHLPEGMTRINMKMKDEKETETEISGIGPKISVSAWQELKEKIQQLQNGDTLVLSGNIPESLPNTAYGELTESVKDKNVRVIVDTEGQALLASLSHRPYLIKPNCKELGNLFGVTVNSFENAEFYAGKLQQEGARNVLVSMGKEGALLLTEKGNVHIRKAYRGNLVSSVGAGDSMIAGFLAGKMHKLSEKECLHLAVAAGSATAFANGLATKDAVHMLFITE